MHINQMGVKMIFCLGAKNNLLHLRFNFSVTFQPLQIPTICPMLHIHQSLLGEADHIPQMIQS